jgi:hypothetical protein
MGEDLSRFKVMALTMHPYLVPTKVGCMVQEPEGPLGVYLPS